jgi:predicted ATPase/DNA-binding winged helix-turn-helix (wHTH) protein
MDPQRGLVMAGATPRQPGCGSRAAVEFGPFRYEPLQRQVLSAEGPLRIGSRALELLDALLEEPGRLYTRDELVSRVWRRTVVEETSLRVHMSALRRQLGERCQATRYITTVPGRGYAFTAPVRPASGVEAAVIPPQPSTRAIPVGIHAPIGRDDAIARVATLVSQSRLVSVVGPEGVGKTTVVNIVAAANGGTFVDGVLRVDLGGALEPSQAVMQACHGGGLWPATAQSPAAPEDVLLGRRMLIVLDHGDHVIDAVAALVNRLMLRCDTLRFIVAGCEPLGIEAERVLRLAPLELPEPQAPADLDALLRSPAIRLFVERACANSSAFVFTQENAKDVRQICTFLDGMPLAIELAAARVSTLGIEGLASRCEDVLHILGRGRRTAEPRHQSLRASLACGYDRLNALERLVLRRLSVLAGPFTLGDAAALLADLGPAAQPPVRAVLDMCTKSVLHCEGAETAEPRYRLLQAMRLFLRELAALEGRTPPSE